MQYHFCIVCEDVICFYNQKEITTCVPSHTYHGWFDNASLPTLTVAAVVPLL